MFALGERSLATTYRREVVKALAFVCNFRTDPLVIHVKDKAACTVIASDVGRNFVIAISSDIHGVLKPFCRLAVTDDNTHVRLVNVNIVFTKLAALVALAQVHISLVGAALVVVFSLHLARNGNGFGVRAVFLRRFVGHCRLAWIHQVNSRSIRVDSLVDKLEHFMDITAAKLNHAFTAKVIRVLAVSLEALGRGQAELFKVILELSDTAVLASAAVIAFLEEFARHKRHFVFVQAKRINHVLVGLVNGLAPVGIGTVTFALVEDEALDDAHFLCLLGKFQNASRRVVVVILGPAPVHDVLAIAPEISFVLILVEGADAHSTDGNRDNAHSHARQGIHHRAAKVVCRGEVFERMEHRRNCRVPFARLDRLIRLAAALACICIVRSKHDKVLGRICLVLGRYDIAVTRHVGLPVSNVNMEVRVRSRIRPHRKHRKPSSNTCIGQDFFQFSFHAHFYIP